MTAEVGILNRMGVALAADSAVTIGSHGSEKVYNSANKLFSLSKYHPVGIMIYGGANLMGIPWETIIKTFRQHIGSRKMEKLSEYCDLFITFLKSDPRFYNDYSEKDLIERLFNDLFMEILAKVEIKINSYMEKDNKPDEQLVETWIHNITWEYYDEFNNKDIIEGFEDTYDEFIDKYSQLVSDVVDNYMAFDISEQLNSHLIDLAFNFITRDVFSSNCTGLVIAGYGEDELFPSLYEYKIEGIIHNNLKIKLKDQVKIGPTNNEETSIAAITPFAQKEMVHSFLRGIDPRLTTHIISSLDSVLNVYPNIIKEKIAPNLSDEEVTQIKDLGNELLEAFIIEMEKNQNENFTQPVIEIVKILPKEELAAMAEALVNLTSFKRKITIETETVGGPIDVAVITKGDGLVWIKRKHYFKPELNYHFFQNYLRGDGNDYASDGE